MAYIAGQIPAKPSASLGTLLPAGPIEAASNAETSMTQLVQEFTICAQVKAAALCMTYPAHNIFMPVIAR